MKLIVVGKLEMVPQGLEEKGGEIGNQIKNWDHPDHSIVKIDQKSEKSPRKLRRLAVIHSSEKPRVQIGVKNSLRVK